MGGRRGFRRSGALFVLGPSAGSRETRNQGAPGNVEAPWVEDPLALGVRGSIQQRATAKPIPPSGAAAD
jgi:hypothetical protein